MRSPMRKLFRFLFGLDFSVNFVRFSSNFFDDYLDFRSVDVVPNNVVAVAQTTGRLWPEVQLDFSQSRHSGRVDSERIWVSVEMRKRDGSVETRDLKGVRLSEFRVRLGLSVQVKSCRRPSPMRTRRLCSAAGPNERQTFQTVQPILPKPVFVFC